MSDSGMLSDETTEYGNEIPEPINFQAMMWGNQGRKTLGGSKDPRDGKEHAIPVFDKQSAERFHQLVQALEKMNKKIKVRAAISDQILHLSLTLLLGTLIFPKGKAYFLGFGLVGMAACTGLFVSRGKLAKKREDIRNEKTEVYLAALHKSNKQRAAS